MKPSGELKAATRKPAKRVSPVADVDIFTYNVGARDAMASNFLENTERLSKYALATYGDLGRIIKEKKYPKIPRTVIDPDDDMYEGLSNARIEKMQLVVDQEWAKDVKKLGDQKTKFYGFLQQLLTEEGEERIQNNAAEWAIMDGSCDPLLLWLAIIKTHGLHTDDMSAAESRRSARTGYQRCYQLNGESLLNYYNRFRQAVNIIQAVGEVEPSEDTQAIDFFEGLDKRLYGEMLRDLKNRVRNRESTFPDTLAGAHGYAKNYIPPYVRRSDVSGSKSVYHAAAEYDASPAPSVVSTVAESRPQKKTCDECGRFHFGKCWGRNREKSPFAAPKVVNIHDSNDMSVNNKKNDSASGDNESHYYMGNPVRKEKLNDIDITRIIYKCSMPDEVYDPDSKIVYLDSCANAHVMHNIELLSEIRHDEKSAIKVKGVGGETILRDVGKLPCFGDVHVLNSDNRVNILSLGKVKDMYEVDFIEGDFHVTINKDMVLIFRRMNNDLWGCDFHDIISALKEIDTPVNKKVMMIDTVTERESKFSTKEVSRAKYARKIMRQLGYPSTRDIIKMIVKGWMINIPVTVQDIIRAEKIYGPDVASLKGKTVKRKPREQPKVYVPRAMMKKQDMYSDIVIDRMNTLYEADEKTNSKILQPFEEDAPFGNEEQRENNRLEDLIEQDILNDVTQFDQDGVDNEVADEEQGFNIGHEEEGIDSTSKKDRAMGAIRDIFVPVNNQQMESNGENIEANNDDNTEAVNNDEGRASEILGSVEIDGVRKSRRLINQRYVNVMQRTRHVRTVNRGSHEHFVFSLTRSQAYKRHATDAEKAAIKEITQIYDRGTLKILDRKLMTLPQLRRLIHSALIFDDKYDMNGIYERLKARLVARGNEMDETLYEDRSSPTISTIHVMIMLAIAAKERRKIRILDIGNAFLEASMKTGEEVYVELDHVSSRILAMLDSSIASFMGENGKFVARLDKALYGCIQSAKLWFDKLTEVLVGYGFTANPCDACVMNKTVNGKQISVGFHVDDLLITCEDDSTIDDVIAHLRSQFREVKEKKEDTMGYLGMRISVRENGIYVDMNAYTIKILDEFSVGGNAHTPATEDLFNDRDVPLLPEIDKKRFHSVVAKLLYLAKRTRPDILLTVSHLASRVTVANQDDMGKLNRMLRYLNGHKQMSLHFRGDGDMTLRSYIDASFAIHSNGTSRTGMVIEFGGATVCAWTSKQKMTTKSACEAELVGLSDGSSEVLGCREFLQYQGYDIGPAIIYQDNTSVLDLVKAGHPTSHRTRHLKARYFFIKDYIDAEEIVLKHMGTEWMLADYLTKPLCGEKFQRFLEIIIGLVATPA